MRRSQGRVVRPTFRCLAEDLNNNDFGPREMLNELKSFAQARDQDSTAMLPLSLTDIDHPIVDKANEQAAASGHKPERIRTFRSHHVYKVKTSASRGAVWVDENGQWWLIATGRRRASDTSDFYKQMEEFDGDVAPLLPTKADRNYLRLENAYIDQCYQDKSAQRALLDALLAAAALPASVQSANVHGAIVKVKVEPDTEASTLEISFEFNSFDHQDRFPADLLGYVPGYENMDDWDYLPELNPGTGALWYTYVSIQWISWLADAVRLGSLVSETDLLPLPSKAGSLAHRTPVVSLKAGLVDGLEVVALCGARFTPSRDPLKYNQCEECNTAFAQLNGP